MDYKAKAIIVGRKKEENDNLEKLGKDWIKMECKDVMGPITIVKDDKNLKKAAELTAFYAHSEKTKEKIIFWTKSKKNSKTLEVTPLKEKEVDELRI